MRATLGTAVLIFAGAATAGTSRAQAPWQTGRAAGEVGASAIPSPAGGDTVRTRRLWSLGSQRWLGPGGQSPDGRYVAYTDWATGDLAVHDVVGQTDRRLTDKGSWLQNGTEWAQGAVFSPDGRSVAYAWVNSENHFELRVVRLAGGAPRILFPDDETQYLQPFAWSPDGRSILARLARRGRDNQVVTISVAGGTVRVLKSFAGGSRRASRIRQTAAGSCTTTRRARTAPSGTCSCWPPTAAGRFHWCRARRTIGSSVGRRTGAMCSS